MFVRKIILLFIFGGVLPLSAFGAAADFDNSLTVDFNDLKLFTDYWLYDYNDNQRCDSWDLAVNGQIDFYDLYEFANQWLLPYEFVDFADFGQYWRKTVDYRFEDTRFDLTDDGFVDLKDFSSFSSEWLTTKNCCDNNNFDVDPNYFKNWQFVSFTGIGDCDPLYGCFDPVYSDPCNDKCGNKVIVSCEETPDMGYYCAYNFWYNTSRVGLCVYNCGQNYFWILKNKYGCRILATMHFVYDLPPQDPHCQPWGCNESCDEGNPDYYNWQLVITWYPDPSNPNYRQQIGICRQSIALPNFQSDNVFVGSSGPCKYHWWPY